MASRWRLSVAIKSCMFRVMPSFLVASSRLLFLSKTLVTVNDREKQNDNVAEMGQSLS
jgi:hypothetical protein